jgi:hypothetical protein
MPGTNAFASDYPANEDGYMSKVRYLKEQAARADRLARAAFDDLTTERLQQAAKDYLREADQFAASLKTTDVPDKSETAPT